MKTIMIEVEESKFEQFMGMMDLLKSDVVKKLQVQKIEDEFKIDEQHCLELLDKINRGDFSDCAPMGDIDAHIQELKHAII